MSISWENAIIGKNETQEFSANPIINKKVKIAVSGLQRTTQKYFITDIINEKDQELAADFIIFCVNRIMSSLKPDVSMSLRWPICAGILLTKNTMFHLTK